MNLKFNKDGKLEFDFHDFLQYISADSKLELMESFACDDVIIKHVADQIIHRWTENSYSGGSACTVAADTTIGHHCALDVAWREVAKNSGEVAKREIERLETALKSKEEENQALREEMDKRRNTYCY